MPDLMFDHDLVMIYAIIDDTIKDMRSFKQSMVGRPSILSDSEMITILVYNTLFLHQKNLKDIWKFIRRYHQKEFTCLPKYSAFVAQTHRVVSLMCHVLSLSLVSSEINFVDSTMLEVCKLKRADSHKVAKKVAAFGKNHQGWHYGFKLHAMIDQRGLFSAFCFSGANIYDAQMLPKLVKKYMKVIVGDSHYGARVMREKIWKEYKILIIAPPHWKQKTKLAAMWQNTLLSMRSKIESVFDILKEHLHLVTSFPRSVKGYLLHYLRTILAYQFLVLLKFTPGLAEK